MLVSEFIFTNEKYNSGCSETDVPLPAVKLTSVRGWPPWASQVDFLKCNILGALLLFVIIGLLSTS